MRRIRHATDEREDDVDLNPLIDIVTLLIVFFILGGRLSGTAVEQITAPPAMTGVHETPDLAWERVTLDIVPDGAARDGAAIVHLGRDRFRVPGADLAGYAPIRALLDRVWDRAAKLPDPARAGALMPRVTLALRADADAPYRVVQELQQVAADSLDPTAATDDPLTPRRARSTTRPFTSIEFAVRPLDARPVLR